MTDTATIEGEVVSRELVPATETGILTADVDAAMEAWESYQTLTRRLLDENDYQKIGGKRFKKKSAWRKYANAFKISDHVTYEHIERDESGFPKWARVRVEAFHEATGRRAEADQECHVNERCCVQPCKKRNWKDHYCCKADCNGRSHWSHPGDLPATALTRAKNRAISDLIGAGEVSAEEMENSRQPEPEAAPPIQRPLCPEHQLTCQLMPAGESGGKPYPAFFSCPKKDCKAGKKPDGTPRRFGIGLAEWQDILSQQANENTPREEYNPDDVPSE